MIAAFVGAALAAIGGSENRNPKELVAAKAAPTCISNQSPERLSNHPLAKVTSKALAVRTREAASGNSSLIRSLSPPSIA